MIGRWYDWSAVNVNVIGFEQKIDAASAKHLLGGHRVVEYLPIAACPHSMLGNQLMDKMYDECV